MADVQVTCMSSSVRALRLRTFLYLFWPLAICLWLPAGLHAEVLVGRVVALSDGDTVTVLDGNLIQHRVRLAGIDAPEKRQPYFTRSKTALAQLVMGKQVLVEWRKRDRYRRLVGVVRAGDVDAGLQQVQAGLAWHYKAYEREQPLKERRLYADAETQARTAHKGLWADNSPQPPWHFRRERR